MSDVNAHTPAYSRRKEHRPSEIVAAALEEFHAEGYARASLARIAKRAGVSRATLYLYFDGKDALFGAVATAAMAPLIHQLKDTPIAISGTSREVIEASIRQFYATIISTKNSALMRILIAEGKAHPDIVLRYHRLISDGAKAALTSVIQRGIARGDLRPGPVEHIPQVIVAPAMMYLVHKMVFSDVEDLDQDAFMDAHLDVVLNGILNQT